MSRFVFSRMCWFLGMSWNASPRSLWSLARVNMNDAHAPQADKKWTLIGLVLRTCIFVGERLSEDAVLTFPYFCDSFWIRIPFLATFCILILHNSMGSALIASILIRSWILPGRFHERRQGLCRFREPWRLGILDGGPWSETTKTVEDKTWNNKAVQKRINTLK